MTDHADRPTDHGATAALRRMTPGRLARLCRKELRETLRDRRTIVTLLVMPLLIYPLLSVTFQKFFLQALTPDQSIDCIVGVETEQARGRLRAIVGRGEEWLRANEAKTAAADAEGNSTDLTPEQLAARSPRLHAQWVVTDKPRQDVADGKIDIAVLLDGAASDSSEGVPAELQCEMLYRSGSPLSRTALEYVQGRLQAANDRYLYEHLQELAGFRLPVRARTVALQDSGPSVSLTTMIPLILILMTITGAVYPAIDLTAGERERGTLETLMAAPVPRGGLLLAKYLAVLVVALLTATANLAAMSLTLSFGGLAVVLLGKDGLAPLVMAQVFGLMALFAAFFSAVALALTSFARSFKEAQAYLIPLMLMCLAPGVLSLMPGMRLTPSLAILPLVNIVLLARDVLSGTVEPLPALIAVASTFLYALAAIGAAARIFGSDAVLYGSQAAWSDLLQRSPEPRPAAPLSGALFCLALLFPATFLANGLLSQFARAGSIDVAIAMSGLALLLVFGVVPGLFAYLQHVEPTAAFRAYPPPWVTLAASVILGVSLWPLAHELVLLGDQIGLGGLSAEKLEGARQLFERWKTANPAIILLALALTPAMCEEWFFRGYLFSSLQRASGLLAAIVVSAVLFGLFHVIASTVLATERFLPSTMLGLVLGLVAWRSGSVIPGIVLHMIHNGLLLSTAIWSEQIEAWGWGVEEQTHLPLWCLAVSAVAVGVGLVLLFLIRPPQREAPGAAQPPSAGEVEALSA